MADSSYDCIVIGAGPGRIRSGDPRRTARHEDGGDREGQAGGSLPELRVHPSEGGIALGGSRERDPRGRRYGISVSGIEVDYAAVQARRAKVVETLTGGVGGLFKKNGIDVIAGAATLAPAAKRSSDNGGGR